MTKILLVDDHALLRKGFRMVLETELELEVVGEAADGRIALEQVASLSPDVVLMDIRMPGGDGIDATERIVQAHPATRVLVLTTFDLDEYAFGALRAGASGFLLKNAQPAELVAAVRAVAAGDAVVEPRITQRMLEMFSGRLPAAGTAPGPDGSDPRLTSLTPRELEVLRLVAEGLSNVEIAERLFLSTTTIKTHTGNLLAKLALRDRVQAVIFAYESGVVRPGSID
ncbi:response regulator [Georgenia halophila]|uniref:Response regulator n=1 Tax=Georgenia halophila TaxID=620889 RepID=A0ABP8LLB7_9MICO